MTRLVRSALLATILYLGTLPAIAHETGAHPLYDPQIDAIVGNEEAPHTLVAYLSPGCFSCIYFANQLMQPDVREDLIEQGKLRVIFRAVPTIVANAEALGASEEDAALAKRNSVELAILTRCAARYGRENGELYAWSGIFNGYREALGSDRNKQWPYVTRTQMGEVYRTTMWYAGLDDQETANCVKAPELRNDLIDSFSPFISHVRDFEVQGVPVIFLNGEAMEWSTRDPEGFRDALSQAINN